MLAAEATLAEATPAEMAGTRMYGLADLGRLVSREGTAVTGFGPIGLPAMAKSHAASPVDLFSTREDRNSIGLELGANVLVDTRSEAALARAKDLTDNKAAEQESDCTRTEATINQALHKINRRGKACLVVSPKLPGELDPGCLAVDNIYVDGTRTEGGSPTHGAMACMTGRRLDATQAHARTFPMRDLPNALRRARKRIDDSIKVTVSTRNNTSGLAAAEWKEGTCQRPNEGSMRPPFHRFGRTARSMCKNLSPIAST